MREKLYKPIIKDGDHILHSKENPNRVRGLTRDKNNKNPNIIEWEEVDLGDYVNGEYNLNSYKKKQVQLTTEQEIFTPIIRKVLDTVIAEGSSLLFEEIIFPWLKNKLCNSDNIKTCKIKKTNRREKAKKSNITVKSIKKEYGNLDCNISEISYKIDNVFKQYNFELDEEEAKTHTMRLIYHLLGMMNEIRIISNAQVRKKYKSEELCIEKQKEVERFISEKVAICLDNLLSKLNLKLDLDTSRELFYLTGGGVCLNGEYVPIQANKIDEALKALEL